MLGARCHHLLGFRLENVLIALATAIVGAGLSKTLKSDNLSTKSTPTTEINLFVFFFAPLRLPLLAPLLVPLLAPLLAPLLGAVPLLGGVRGGLAGVGRVRGGCARYITFVLPNPICQMCYSIQICQKISTGLIYYNNS